jgi:hypothetical protein
MLDSELRMDKPVENFGGGLQGRESRCCDLDVGGFRGPLAVKPIFFCNP